MQKNLHIIAFNSYLKCIEKRLERNIQDYRWLLPSFNFFYVLLKYNRLRVEDAEKGSWQVQML